MKSYTDLEQSKKLAEILPLESADMYYTPPLIKGHTDYIPHLKRKLPIDWDIEQKTPSWSLAALLDVLKCFDPDIIFLQSTTDGRGTHLVNVWRLSVESLDVDITLRDIYADNLVDACVEMILRLNEQKLL